MTHSKTWCNIISVRDTKIRRYRVGRTGRKGYKYDRNFKNFKVKATYKGDKLCKFIPNNYNNHMVKVTNLDNGRSCTFEFWASISSPELSSKYDVLNAFYCFVSDSICGMDTFTDFCSEFGYDEYDEFGRQNPESKKIYNACKRSLSKLERIYNGDLYDLANELNEEYA